MSEILKDSSTPRLIAAIEANLFELLAGWGRSPLGELHDGPDMMRYVTGIPHPLFNGVFRARFDQGGIDPGIDETLRYFRFRQLPMTWWFTPSTRPSDLGERLI